MNYTVFLIKTIENLIKYGKKFAFSKKVRYDILGQMGYMRVLYGYQKHYCRPQTITYRGSE